jgi:hypothetical protein
MKTFLSGLCATALAFSVTATSLLPASATPNFVPKPGFEASGDVVTIHHRRWHNGGWGNRRALRWDRRDERRDYYRSRSAYYNGYRGYDHYRPGYRRYGDYWYPAAAFLAGAIVGSAIANSQARPVYSGGDAHTQWCYNRYRSYRAYDNTFQPYNGPRQQCYSPY